MKVKSNKGFAITALLYGLSIMAFMTIVLMMSIMQNSRKNNTTTVKNVEQELNNFGSTASNYTVSGSTKKIIPQDQGGYYKIELCGTNTLATGTVYLPGNTELNILVGATSTITVDSETIMSVGSDSPFINGMAQFATDENLQKYPFLNGQLIKNASCSNGFKMNKVSTDTPKIDNTVFNSVTSIKTVNGSNTNVQSAIKIISYNPSTPDAKPTLKKCNSPCPISPAMNISDIYIDYSPTPPAKGNARVVINSKDISPQSNYSFNENGFSFSRFGPTSNTNIQNGNYAIAKVASTGSGSSRKFNITEGKKDTLSTSTYTPAAEGTNTMCQVANRATNPYLIHYGSESLARPVVLKNYASTNGQKWRFEHLGSNKYKITEIEEYKQFEVHKNDASQGTEGPVLVCGEYVCYVNSANPSAEVFQSTDSYGSNPNQIWTLTAAGLGTYLFKTNEGVGIDQYLYYESEKFYVTNDLNKASLFYIYNVIY